MSKRETYQLTKDEIDFLRRLRTGDIILNGRRVRKASDAILPDDYVTLRQVTGTVETIISEIDDNEVAEIEVDPNGALEENPLGVKVDEVTITINSDNELEVINPVVDGYWTIGTNGDPVTPEIIFDSDGDVISWFVPS